MLFHFLYAVFTLLLVFNLLRHQLNLLLRSSIYGIQQFLAFSLLFLLLRSPLLPINSSSLKSIANTNIGSITAQTALCAHLFVELLTFLSGEADTASIVTFSDAGVPAKNSFRCKLHNHDLPFD